MKRFQSQFYDYPLILCHKVRDGDKRIITVKEGDVKGKHVLIVDDLVKTGGTLVECKNALLRAGASKVSAYVTHAVFPQNSWQRFAASSYTFLFTAKLVGH
jgi:phosphoribosylpyrophosphate synthetase